MKKVFVVGLIGLLVVTLFGVGVYAKGYGYDCFGMHHDRYQECVKNNRNCLNNAHHHYHHHHHNHH